MKKRISAFFCAMLLLLCCTLPTFAMSHMPLAIVVESMDPTTTVPTAMNKVKTSITEFFQNLSNFGRRYLLLIIVIIVLVIIVVSITISEMKMQKEREEKAPPKKQHKK